MKKIIYSMLLGGLIFFLPACSKFTEITPKGKNILNRVSDLDLILNFNYSYNSAVTATSLAGSTTANEAFNPIDAAVVVNDLYPTTTNVPALIAAGTKTLPYALVTYDETIDRKALATSDMKYEKMYFIINNVCNVVIKNADQASGDRVVANRLKCEAYILRAYMHYLLVNFYARAYNPASAATDGGVPYVKEDNLSTTANVKSTVAEVYANVLNDINTAFDLNGLPSVPVNNMRAGLGFAYGVKAKVLLSMHNYTGAMAAADASLAINSTVIDYNAYAPVGTSPFNKPIVTAPDNLFYASYNGAATFQAPSLEVMTNYETGNVLNDYIKPYYPLASPFNPIAGSKLFYAGTAVFAINTIGITTTDTYLIKAECQARSNDVVGAMATLNALRKKRVKTSVYTDLNATTEPQAMAHLMKFSRTEFLYTFKNYLNIKRWNTEDAYKQTITRTVNGVAYTLKPESPLYIFPFPLSATDYNTNLTQNY
ncbi:MAG: RagB/SusD family nutrient uptake outer membrane protein [Bacteroidota bacterium]